ncbi:MAG: prolyl oligopeptidase family serine peptidase [Candidatus Saccharibacteria bacterium]|nr:prolyl oligopeptidase family serine peptidase [Pseudorhodobacter sp.]
MTRSLKFGRRAAASGKARSLVVFVHGYGANGADLLDLADIMAPHLPHTALVAPDAADRVPGAPMGYQWFPIPRFDGSTEAQAQAGLTRSAADLSGFVDQRLAYEGVGPEAVALVGFSQGAMMALHVAPRREVAMAAVVAISGRLLAPERLPGDLRVRPPVLIMHGDQDPVVAFSEMAIAADALAGVGFDTFGHVMKGMGHGISQDGLSTALGFLKKHMPG